MNLSSFDPFDPAYLADPYPALARVREATPALWIEKHRFYLVTRYADVVFASKRHEIFSSTGGVGIEWQPRPMMPMLDPPEHTKLRRLVAPFFLPRAVEAWSVRIREATTNAVDRAIADGEVDSIRDLAEPIALVTLAAVLGLPRERQSDLRRWADGTMADLAGGGTPETEALRKEFVRYLRAVIAERGKGDDLLGVLLQEGDREALVEKEIVAFCVLLVVAGFEPSASAIGNVVGALARHVGNLELLGSSEAELAVNADELLRYDSSVHAFFRNTKLATTIGHVPIPKDAKVMLHFGAANRDPAVFVEPDRLLLGRRPNPHVAFGAGPHHCLGAALAQLQLRTLLAVLKERASRVEELEPGDRHDNLLFHGMKRYRVRFVAR